MSRQTPLLPLACFSFLAKQPGDSPNYGQGWDAYAKRLCATSADGFSDIMIGGAILPSLLHQDPRYFYQGTGTSASRIRHAAFSPFVARYDDGHWGPNYSSLGGDLTASALSVRTRIRQKTSRSWRRRATVAGLANHGYGCSLKTPELAEQPARSCNDQYHGAACMRNSF